MTHGEFAAKVIGATIARRRELPAPFRDLEHLDPSLEVFSRAYNELNEDRPREAQKLFPITRRMVIEWLEWYGWADDFEFKQRLWECIKACDAVYFEIMGAKLKQQQAREARRAALANKRAAGKQAR